jgi:hypothetical protein
MIDIVGASRGSPSHRSCLLSCAKNACTPPKKTWIRAACLPGRFHCRWCLISGSPMCRCAAVTPVAIEFWTRGSSVEMACAVGVGSSRLQQSYGLIAHVRCLFPNPFLSDAVSLPWSSPPVWLSWLFWFSHPYVRTTITDRRYQGHARCLSHVCRHFIPTQLDDRGTSVRWSRNTSPPFIKVSPPPPREYIRVIPRLRSHL